MAFRNTTQLNFYSLLPLLQQQYQRGYKTTYNITAWLVKNEESLEQSNCDENELKQGVENQIRFGKAN